MLKLGSRTARRHDTVASRYEGRTYFHGTHHGDWQPGHVLSPATDRDPGPHYTEDPKQEWRAGRVWGYDEPYRARNWGQHVYEVKLHDPQRHHPEDYDHDRAEVCDPDGQHHGSSGEVIRKVPQHEIDENEDLHLN